MTARQWGSPADRVMGRICGAVFLVLATASTYAPGVEAITTALVVAVGGAALAGWVLWLTVRWLVSERAIAWECVRPLDGLPDPDTGKPYRAQRPARTSTGSTDPE